MGDIKHPAKYSDQFIPLFAEILKGTENVIDIFAGTCKIAKIKDYGYEGKIYCNEIEPEWALMEVSNIDGLSIGDAASLPYKDNFFEAVCTSPTYGNRMADSHNAKDGSRRNTYTHTLGRRLHEENTGKMQWGDKYKDKHIKCWEEARRVLKPGGILVLNMSDHIRRGKVIPVTNFHKSSITFLGFELIEHKKIPTKRLRQGKNAEVRVSYESVLVFKKV